MNEWLTEWINEWMNEWMDKWMNEWCVYIASHITRDETIFTDRLIELVFILSELALIACNQGQLELN